MGNSLMPTELAPLAPKNDPKAPALGLGAFVCPHCDAHTQQTWWDVCGEVHNSKDPPFIADPVRVAEIIEQCEDNEKDEIRRYGASLTSPYPLPYREKESWYIQHRFLNLFISRCYVCSKGAIWLQGKLIYPAATFEVKPNADLPDDVRADFEEAALIANLSPRGAAALLRLAIEKLCRHLGKSGKVDKMIEDLVADGLHKKVQQALDVVRVVGNESVHPGSLDLKDDAATVQSLFRLVNIIAETMITEERKVAELYGGLPPDKLRGIEQRNERARKAREGGEGGGK